MTLEYASFQPFPDPETHATPEGIVAFGGDLEPEHLLGAYRQGIFPWPISGVPVPIWFCPPERAILEWQHLHISRSLGRMRNKNPFLLTIDKDFEAVIESCAQTPRPGQEGTWITAEMKSAYCRLHRLGHAHSVEAWDGSTLVGGIYGVDAGGAFAAESMFYRKSFASKLALLFLMEHLHSRGCDWLDIQMLTPHMEAMGAKLVSRTTFLSKLSQALKQNRDLF